MLRLHRLSLARHDHLRIDVASAAGVRGRGLVRGEYRGSLPLRATIKQDGPLGDVVGTFWANVYAVTQRFTEVLRRLDVRGWDVLPIELYDAPALANLSLLTVTGRSGPIDERGLGRFLDPAQWDGSDIFLPANSQGILVSGELADQLRVANLVDLELEPAGLERVEH